MSAVKFSTDQVTTGISNCSKTKAFGPDELSIFHLKNLGSRAIKYLTACHIMSNCGDLESSIVIPIPKPDN